MGKNRLEVDSERRRCPRLQTKLGIAFSALAIITSALLTFTLFLTARQQLREDTRERLRNIASIAALQIDGNAHAQLVDRSQEHSETYLRIKWTLQKIRDRSRNVRFMYTWRFNNAGELVFVVDAETDPNEMSHIGDVYISEDDPTLAQKLAVLKGPMADERFTSDQWGVWLSGYAPFYRSDGHREGILGVDIAAADVIAKETKFLRVALFVFGCTIPLAMALGWLLGRKLAGPIKRLTIASERIAEGDLNYRVNEQCSNEIRILSLAFNRMAQNLQEEIQARGREIAQRKQAERKLAELNKELEATIENLSAANRELLDVAYISAHDLKTPARAVGSLASMIRSDYENTISEEVKNELNMIVSKAQRMINLLDGMLEYCGIERVIGFCELVNTNEVVKTVLAKAVPPENIEIIIENELPVIESNRSHIELLFTQLIRNAIQFIDKPRGVVKIACTDKDSFRRFSISDNGRGIERRHFKKIFRLFQTLDRNNEDTGIGLGLTIAKKIVEMYQGVIWVESQPGLGSTFFFALPKQQICKSKANQPFQEIATT